MARTRTSPRPARLPPLGVLLFVLRPRVVIELAATAEQVAAMPPGPDAWEPVARALRGEQPRRRGLRRPAWLTLREAAAAMCRDDRIPEVAQGLERAGVLRRVGAWEIVEACDVVSYARDVGAELEERFLRNGIARFRMLREADRRRELRSRPRWVFSDGTHAFLGGHIEGASVFARELWAELQQGRVGVEWGPHPGGGRWIDVNALEWFDLWLQQEAAKPWRRELALELIERPANIPALPRVRWPKLPPGAIA